MTHLEHTSARPRGLDPESRQMVLDTVQRIREKLLPWEKVLELDADAAFPEHVVRAMLGPEIGLQLLFIPEDFGGMGGGAGDCSAVTRAMARVCLGISTAFFALQLGADPILVAGTPEQKNIWLGRIAQGTALVAYAVTEPEAGSNLAAIQTRAEPVSDGNGTVTGYRINGSKQFISTGGFADFLTVLAKAPEGPTFFIVEKGAKGFCAGKPEKKHGIRVSNTAPLSFSDVFVPMENLVGGVPGRGLAQANQVFGYTRLMVASMALGAMERTLQVVIPYARQRVQFKTPLSEKQGYTHKLVVPHVARMAAAEAFIEAVAARYDSGDQDLEVEGSIAKYFATESADKAAGDAMQALGGYGYMAEYEVEKIKRDVKITCIYEGTSEIQQNIIGTFRWKKTFKTKGGFYEGMAQAMEALAAKTPGIGAEALALAARAVNASFLLAHEHRLTRRQIVLFALADMAAWVETGWALCEKAALDPAPKTVLASRIFATEVAQKCAQGASFAALGTGELPDAATRAFLEKVRLHDLFLAQKGAIQDADALASLVFQG